MMKIRLHITIKDEIFKRASRYAEQHQTSLSQLIASYLYSVTKPVSKSNIIQLIDKLPSHPVDIAKDLNKGYYEDQKVKYGI
jgi:Family of unknown function (DUF6364)